MKSPLIVFLKKGKNILIQNLSLLDMDSPKKYLESTGYACTYISHLFVFHSFIVAHRKLVESASTAVALSLLLF